MSKQTFTTGQVLTAAQMTSLQQTAMGGGSTTAKTTSYVLVAADAGTVVQMNAAGATTITVNTALFAAGDSVQIQNVGAGVCTVTAGTATVSTSATLALKQYDAGSLYFNTTSAAIFFAVDAADGMANVLTTTGDIIYSSSGTTAARLGIGSSAQVLTVASGVPSWATPAGAAVSHVRVINSTTSLVNGATTKLTFTTESYDTLNEWASNRFTATAAGYYAITGTVVMSDASTSNGSLHMQIWKNGAQLAVFHMTAWAALTSRQAAMVSTTINLVATDYIEFYVFNSMYPTGTPNGTNGTFATIDRLQD